MTNQISYNNTTHQDADADVRSSVVNPLYYSSSASYGATDGKRYSVSGARGRSVAYSDARRDDMKEDSSAAGHAAEHEEQRDELLGVLAKEREKHDASHARTMGLLQKKDDMIDELSVACDEAHERIAELERVVEEEQMKRRDAESKVERLETTEKELRRGAEEQKKSYDRMIKGLHEEMQVLHDGVTQKAAEVDAEREHRKNVEIHMEDVSQG
eukprot:jgi/Picre1/32647/NNA_007993.t1